MPLAHGRTRPAHVHVRSFESGQGERYCGRRTHYMVGGRGFYVCIFFFIPVSSSPFSVSFCRTKSARGDILDATSHRVLSHGVVSDVGHLVSRSTSFPTLLVSLHLTPRPPLFLNTVLTFTCTCRNRYRKRIRADSQMPSTMCCSVVWRSRRGLPCRHPYKVANPSKVVSGGRPGDGWWSRWWQ
ncbi:hypothetical protein EDD17DRAFT_37285 [Pisolithus thermaeus]|nr:hypothetical protein EDD17DRAFT_37285 [Pisolithus thermaeus]